MAELNAFCSHCDGIGIEPRETSAYPPEPCSVCRVPVNASLQVTADKVYCERCAEAPAIVHLQEASYCADCFKEIMQAELGKLFSYTPCCALVRWVGDAPALCLAQSGIEHDHTNSSVR